MRSSACDLSAAVKKAKAKKRRAYEHSLLGAMRMDNAAPWSMVKIHAYFMSDKCPGERRISIDGSGQRVKKMIGRGLLVRAGHDAYVASVRPSRRVSPVDDGQQVEMLSVMRPNGAA